MRLVTLPIEDDLAPYSRHLWTQRIAHRVFEEGGQQVLELARAEDADRARQDYEAWRQGRLQLPHPDDIELAEPAGSQGSLWRSGPLSLLLIAIALVVFLLSGSGNMRLDLTALLTIIDVHRDAESLGSALSRGEFWRLLTPVFLHFSIPHLLFNGAVIFEIGRRIEMVDGPFRFVVLVVLLGVISNFVQFVVGSSPNFGGLSGVAYGLVGYVLVRARLNPAEPQWQLPGGIALGLIIFLVLFSTGITEPFGLHVANGAHWGGLIAGMALAPAVVMLLGERSSRQDLHP